MSQSWPWSIAVDGLSILVRLTPRGGRDAIEGIETLADGRTVVKARVSAAPTKGAANAALVKLAARALEVPARDVHLVAGETARIKRLKVVGDPKRLALKLLSLVTRETS